MRQKILTIFRRTGYRAEDESSQCGTGTRPIGRGQDAAEICMKGVPAWKKPI